MPLDRQRARVYRLLLGAPDRAITAAMEERRGWLCPRAAPRACSYSAVHLRRLEGSCAERIATLCLASEPNDAAAGRACALAHAPRCHMDSLFVARQLWRCPRPVALAHDPERPGLLGDVARLRWLHGVRAIGASSASAQSSSTSAAERAAPQAADDKTLGVLLDLFTLVGAQPTCTLLNPASSFTLLVRVLQTSSANASTHGAQTVQVDGVYSC
jgi:hypothetical protein